MSGEAAPYRARRFSYEEAVFEPRVPHPVPIMIGGNSNAALRRAARYGDLWQGLPHSPEVFAERVRALWALTGERPVIPALRIGWDAPTPVGSVVEQMHAYRLVGAERLAVHVGGYEGARARMESLASAWYAS